MMRTNIYPTIDLLDRLNRVHNRLNSSSMHRHAAFWRCVDNTVLYDVCEKLELMADDIGLSIKAESIE